MSFCEYSLIVFVILLSTASFDFHRRGWLDKVVEYHKNKLLDDFRKIPDVEIKVTIEPAPEGYVDSPAWDFDSVTRLLILLRQSKTALPVRRVLRRKLANTRRKMTFQESFKFFPKLDVKNDLYYDSYSGEMYGDISTQSGIMDDEDKSVIMVANPVEARLPSAMISINLLRNILEERAKAARYMPTTIRTIPWSPMSTTSPVSTTQNGTDQTTGGIGNSTGTINGTSEIPAGNSTVAGETTPAAAAEAPKPS